MVVETKQLSPSDIHNELDSITLRLLNLSQELIHAKLRLEDLTKQVDQFSTVSKLFILRMECENRARVVIPILKHCF
jgi:hypothetical protein